MSTARHDHRLEAALAGVPKPFRERLIRAYLDLKKNFAENRHEAAGMAAGKLCEIVLRLLQQEVAGTHIAFGKKVDNLPAECRKIIEATAPNVVEALRVVVPRALVFLFTMRNKRGIGHVGGDVEANGIDAATMSRVADWVVCELIRVYHKLSIEEAQEIVDAISIRSLPDVWEVGGKRRVLRPELKGKQQVLLLLYGEPAFLQCLPRTCAPGSSTPIRHYSGVMFSASCTRPDLSSMTRRLAWSTFRPSERRRSRRSSLAGERANRR